MTPIANAIISCNIQLALDLLYDQNLSVESLNFIFNQNDSVLSLVIKHCPNDFLFQEIAEFQSPVVNENSETSNAIADSTLNRLTTDKKFSQQTLLMMATRRGLIDIVYFLCGFPRFNVNLF